MTTYGQAGFYWESYSKQGYLGSSFAEILLCFCFKGVCKTTQPRDEVTTLGRMQLLVYSHVCKGWQFIFAFARTSTASVLLQLLVLSERQRLLTKLSWRHWATRPTQKYSCCDCVALRTRRLTTRRHSFADSCGSSRAKTVQLGSCLPARHKHSQHARRTSPDSAAQGPRLSSPSAALNDQLQAEVLNVCERQARSAVQRGTALCVLSVSPASRLLRYQLPLGRVHHTALRVHQAPRKLLPQSSHGQLALPERKTRP